MPHFAPQEAEFDVFVARGHVEPDRYRHRLLGWHAQEAALADLMNTNAHSNQTTMKDFTKSDGQYCH